MSTWQTNLFFQGMHWASLHLLAQQWRPWGVWAVTSSPWLLVAYRGCTISQENAHEIRNPINQSEFNGRSLLGIGPLYCPNCVGITVSHEIRIPICQSGFNGSCQGGSCSLESDQNVRLFGTDCLRWWKTTQFYGDIYFKELRKPWDRDPVNKPTKISCNVTNVFLLDCPTEQLHENYQHPQEPSL